MIHNKPQEGLLVSPLSPSVNDESDTDGDALSKAYEYFIEGIVKSIVDIIPLKPIQKFLQGEIEEAEKEGGQGYDIVIAVLVGVFKLIVMVAVMPFLLIMVVKYSIMNGMFSIGSFAFSGIQKFASETKLNANAIALKNHNDMKFIQKEIQSLKKTG
jgi:hypothetical protein